MSKDALLRQIYGLIGAANSTVESDVALAELYGLVSSASGGAPYEAVEIETKILERHFGSLGCAFFHINPSDKRTAVLATQLYSSGGHTRLVSNIAKALPERFFDVFVSRGVPQELDAKNCSANLIVVKGGFSYRELIESLFRKLVEYNDILIAIHPHDICSAIAVQAVRARNPNVTVRYLNHADHVFSYGISSEVLQLEISAYGYYINAKRAIPINSTFIGVPIFKTDKGFIADEEQGKRIEHLRLFSSGSSFKYKPSDHYSFQSLVSEILRANPKALMTIVGPTPLIDWWWWKLMVSYPKRLSIRRRLRYQEYVRLLDGADIYIDSSPCTGGTAYSEAYYRGLACVGQVPKIFGYSPLDKFRSPSDEKISAAIADFSEGRKNGLIVKRPLHIKEIDEVCSFDNFKRRVSCAWSGDIVDCPLDFVYEPAELNLGLRLGGKHLMEWACVAPIGVIAHASLLLVKNVTALRFVDCAMLLFGIFKRWR